MPSELGVILKNLINDEGILLQHNFNLPPVLLSKKKTENVVVHIKKCSVKMKRVNKKFCKTKKQSVKVSNKPKSMKTHVKEKKLSKKYKKTESSIQDILPISKANSVQKPNIQSVKSLDMKKVNNFPLKIQKPKLRHEYVSLIPEEVEDELKKYVSLVSQIGYMRVKNDVASFVEHLLNRRGLNIYEKSTIFDNSKVPPRYWVQDFLQKNSDLLEFLDIYNDFSLGETFLIETFINSFTEYIQNSSSNLDKLVLKENWSRIFFCGHMQFSKLPHDTSSSRISQTVMFCISACGSLLKPLILSKGFLSEEFETSTYADDKYCQAASEKGQMDAEIFHAWLIEHFNPGCHKKPVLIFLDAWDPYLSVPVLDYGKENNIYFFCIPSRLQKSLDILETSCFPALEQKYQELLEKKSQTSLTRKAVEFSPLLLIAAIELSNFEKCGKLGFKKSDWPSIFESAKVNYKCTSEQTVCSLEKLTGKIEGLKEAMSIVQKLALETDSKEMGTYSRQILSLLHISCKKKLKVYDQSFSNF